MKLYLPIFLLAILFTACNSSENESDADSSKNGDADSTLVEKAANENVLSVEKWDSIAYDYQGNKEYYIISYAGQKKEEDAIAMVDSFKPSYPKAGYLWIPDFA